MCSMKQVILYIAGLKKFILRSNIFACSGKFQVPFVERLKMLLWGFYSDESILYDFKKYNRKDFLTDYQMCCKAVQINAGYTELLNNKMVFSKFSESMMKIPQTYGYILKNKIFFLQPEIILNAVNKNNMEKIKLLLKTKGDIMVKRNDSGSGNGIYKLSMRNERIYHNRKKINDGQLMQLIKKSENYYLCEYVKQAQYSNKIYPYTCNTVKLLTMIHPRTGKAFLARAFHRFGTDKSFPVDNLGYGSCLSNIDLDSGTLGPTYELCENSISWITHHPNTGQPIDGVMVKGFENIVKDVLAKHTMVSYVKYIAWDIVVQDDGYILLEGNSNTDMAGIQPFGPFLLDKRVRYFYKYHHVI